MFEKLQKKWKVNGLQLGLILCTFALGGSACGYLGRKLLKLMHIENDAIYLFAYLAVITLLWPLCVLVVSIPFGQFVFFKNYLLKVKSRILGDRKTKIAIFASGAGSNAKVLIEKAAEAGFQVVLIVCNKPTAGVLHIAADYHIPTLLIEKERFTHGDAYIPVLKEHKVELIVLAGFLWKVPPTLVQAYNNKIINIHPALLPKYGGKGMYGHHVHNAVLAAGETETGITIHFVNEVYDDGEIILQATCQILPTDTADDIARKVHALEHEHYWQAVNLLCKK